MNRNVLRLLALVAVAMAVVLAFLVFAAATSAKVPVTAQGPAGAAMRTDNGWSPLDNLDKIKGSLKKAGFSLQAGSVTYMDWVKETCERNMKDTAFNNPAPNAYATLILPVHEGVGGPLAPWVWQLDEQEAVVLVGQTPPEAVYFSYQTILGFLPVSPWPPPPDFDPKRVAPSVGDAINIGTIKTVGPDRVERPIVIVITGHRGTEKAVRRALLAAGVPEAIINVETIAPALGPLGTKDKGSWFYWAHRVSVPKSESEVLNYLKTIGNHLKVFRVRPNEKLAEQLGRDPEPVPVLRVRGTGHTEMDLYPAVLRLRQAILDRYGAQAHKELDTHVFSSVTAWDGREVLAEKPYPGLQRGIQTLGVTRDTNYLATYPTFMLRQDVSEFVIVYGVNHQKTGKVTYAAVGAYANEDRWFGIGTALSPTFEGSANEFLPGDPDADKLYVLKVARDCKGEDHCLQIKPPKFQDLWGNPYPTNPTCALDDFDTPEKTEIPFNLDQEELFFIFRSYIEPSTLVGPDDNELVYDRAVYFGPYFMP